MAGWLVVTFVLALGHTADAEPDHVSLDVAEEMGVLSSTRMTIAAGYAHRWLDQRAYTEARLGLGGTMGLMVFDARVGLGLVLNRGERVEVLAGWRVGDATVFGQLGTANYSVNMLAVELSVTLLVRFAPGWRLRAEPVAPTLLWNHTYGGTINIALGVDHAL